MRTGVLLPAVLFFTLLPSSLLARPALIEFSGKVFLVEFGTDKMTPARKGFVLGPGDQIHTSAGARAVVAFEDGSTVQVGPNGSFTLQEESAAASVFKMSLGSLRARILKGLQSRFKVRTPTAVCSVRGTEFAVEVSPGGDTSVKMFEGLLAVADPSGKNEVLLKEGQSIQATAQGLGNVLEAAAGGKEDARAAAKREVGLEMSKEEVQAAAALEAKQAIFQQGKAIIDVNGHRVRIEEYIIRPKPDEFKLVVLNERADRFDFFFYRGVFNKELPSDISIALRQLPGCIGSACEYNLTSYQTGRSNTIDNMLETAGGGHQVDVNNNGVAADRVTSAFDPATDQFVSVSVPNPGGAGNTPFFKTLYNTNRLTFNGVTHGGWDASGAAPGGVIQNMGAHITAVGGPTATTVQYESLGQCQRPNCTYNEEGLVHNVVYASNGDGSVWEKYDSYIISDEGKIAKRSDFAGVSSGTDFKRILLNWNFQMIVTASEFQGRKIDLAVEPKIFIQSGLIQ